MCSGDVSCCEHQSQAKQRVCSRRQRADGRMSVLLCLKARYEAFHQRVPKGNKSSF